MRTSIHEGYITYHEREYSLEVFKTTPYVALKHKCPASTPKDNCYDHILQDELEAMKCRYCNQLDIPEGLQALYYLLKWGRQDEENV